MRVRALQAIVALATVWPVLAFAQGEPRALSPQMDTALSSWTLRFSSATAVRVVWETRTSSDAQPGGGPPYLVDTVFSWDTGLRESVLSAQTTAGGVGTAQAFPDPWGPNVESVSVFGGDDDVIRLAPGKMSFMKYPGHYVLRDHAPDWGFRTEWIIARAIADGKISGLAAESLSDTERSYKASGLAIHLRKQANGDWSLAELHRFTPDGWEFTRTTFSEWRPNQPFGWEPAASEQLLFGQKGDTKPSATIHGKLILLAQLPESPVGLVSLDLRNAATVDHASGIIYDASGSKVGRLARSGFDAGWRWGSFALVASAGIAVAVVGVIVIRRRGKRAAA